MTWCRCSVGALIVPSTGPLEARCYCLHRPLLAVCGITESGEGFVHIKAWKGQRLLTEAVVTSGEVSIRCRECGKWHTIKVVYGGRPKSFSDSPPVEEIVRVLDAPRRLG